MLSGPVTFWLNEKPITAPTGYFFTVPAGNRLEMQSLRTGGKAVVHTVLHK